MHRYTQRLRNSEARLQNVVKELPDSLAARTARMLLDKLASLSKPEAK